MKITKYEHACLDVEEQGKRLIIDPGDFAASLSDYTNIVAIVITHVHFDHFNAEKVRSIAAANPGIVIIGPAQVTAQLSDLTTITVGAGEVHEASPFRLKFFGGIHAAIHSSMPSDQNVGVLVNERFYYGGDSFGKPDSEVEILAAPAYGPWMKMAEVMDYITAINPKRTFQTHDIFLSDLGLKLADGRLDTSTKEAGGIYTHLKVGESLEI